MKEKSYFEDIICARATPAGNSAIAVIRVSGKGSFELLNTIFTGAGKKTGYVSHKAHYGSIKDGDTTVDNVLVITFAAGKGFTGEESFEINCHGSDVIVSLVLNLLTAQGARIAEPGEFSKRAFLNGKINLAEAESIMDIVHSSTKRSALIAVRQLSGNLSGAINSVKEQVTDLLAEVEVDIDYPEEDITLDVTKWKKSIDSIREGSNRLLKGFNAGRYFREGVKAVILGKTNSGKSTLFNFLLDEDKAIVSDVHGTTRDFLDGIININGYGARIYDTAGLRDTDDPIEREGTKRARDLSGDADLIIYVISAADGITADDFENLQALAHEQKCLVVINKIDTSGVDSGTLIEQVKTGFSSDEKHVRIVAMSALKKTGLTDFNTAFVELLLNEKAAESEDPIMTNERHAYLLKESLINFDNAGEKIDEGLLDLSAFELREALDRLGEITGEVTPEDVLQRIFSTFCVGK